MDPLVQCQVQKFIDEMHEIHQRIDDNYGYSRRRHGNLISQEDACRLEEISKILNQINPNQFETIEFQPERDSN